MSTGTIWLAVISSIVIAVPSTQLVLAGGEKTAPVQHTSSCELDLNNDHWDDRALLVHTTAGWELLVLLKTEEGYDTVVLAQGHSKMLLSCHFGSTLTETSAGRGKRQGRTYHTNGTYLLLAQPEGARVAYYWNGSSFQEVWTAD